MALQSSGAISISQIKAELGSSSNSLRALSAAAGKGTPDAMSEFYGYSNVTCRLYSIDNQEPFDPAVVSIVDCNGTPVGITLSIGEIRNVCSQVVPFTSQEVIVTLLGNC